MNGVGRIALAAVVVLACSVDVKAQPFPYGWRGGCFGCYAGWPVVMYNDGGAGIAAALSNATVMNNLIAANRPQQMIINQTFPPQSCASYITGYSPNGMPVYVTTCR